MKKRFCLSMIIVLCVLLNYAFGEPKQFKTGKAFTYADGAFSITVDDIIIKDDEKWLKEARKVGNDMIVIAVHITVENVSYSKSYGTFTASDIADLISVNDQDGFSLLYEATAFSTYKDGYYDVSFLSEIKQGTKTRISLPYYADKKTTEATVVLGGGAFAVSVPLNYDKDDKQEELVEKKPNKNNNTADNEEKNIEKRIETLEERVKLLEELVNKSESAQGDNPDGKNYQEDKENAGESNITDEYFCYTTLASYMKNPSSTKMINSVEFPLPEEDYILYLMDISAEDSRNESTVKSYFVVYNKTIHDLSAISFDRVVSHSNDISDMNEVFASYLYLQDGVSSFFVNKLSMSQRSFADYLYAFYEYYFKKNNAESSSPSSSTIQPTEMTSAEPTATPKPTSTSKPSNSGYNYTIEEYAQLIKKGINGTLTPAEAALLERYYQYYK